MLCLILNVAQFGYITILLCITFHILGVERVSSFLSNIPNLLQAKASLRCGSFARALLHWELAYGEDTEAQQSAFVTGTAICRSNTDHTLGFTKTVSDHVGTNSILSSDIQSTLQFSNGLRKTVFTILIGLLDTYASLHDSDGKRLFQLYF